MSEAYTDIDSTMRYYGTATGDKLGAHFTFNFELLGKLTDKDFKVTDVINAINSWLKHMPSIYTANWVLGNHDNHRVATRLGEKNVDAFNMLTAFLPGIMVTYNGEEIGMTDGEVTCEQGKDPQAIKDCSTYRETSRDFERTPMQWNSGPNAGFTDGDKKPWLPVASNYRRVNVENENGTETSHLSIYKQLLQFRKDHLQSMSSKDVLEVKGESDNVVKIVRERDDAKYMLLFNVADEAQEVTLNKHSLLLTTHPKARKVGDILDTIKLEAHESVILKSAAGIQMAASLLMVALYSIVHFVI
ncbi:unnamed protein product [Acanthoscelides obtectus]|uniref:Glycosyl hydrolase family 13 catalytic domain-containing protein n=1 Tax=Acanthoscelides obtectus TaxID=200917 RepID=A0A9P0M0C5_ACAOB|nr:unnamed protein product [Acanthoscelides obtectus]CAK1641608.1 Maltase A3 [Acanthoscelides obtectus]